MLLRPCFVLIVLSCGPCGAINDTTTTQPLCTPPADDHGLYRRWNDPGPNAAWILICEKGFGLSVPKNGVLKECDGTGDFLQPGASQCTQLPGCSKDAFLSLVSDDSSKPNTCFQNGNTMEEGTDCEAVCPSDSIVVGSYLCASGTLLGDTGCAHGDAKQSLRVIDATGVSVKFQMDLDGCSEGVTSSSCAHILDKGISQVVDAQVFRVNVFDGSGSCISSTSNRTYEASNPSNNRRLGADTKRNLASSTFEVHVEFAILAADLSTPLEVLQRTQALGTTGSSYYNSLKTHLASYSPPITLASSQVLIGAQPFTTTVAVSPMSGAIESLQDLPAPVFPSTTGSPEKEQGVGLPLAIAIIAGIIVALLCCAFVCYKFCQMRKALHES